MSKYVPIEHQFKIGEKILNNNGYFYKVKKIVDKSNILFERVSDGEQVLAYNPKLFIKDGEKIVLEWGSGKYY